MRDGDSSGSAARWRPTASPRMLRARAALLAQLRMFFAQRGVLEVETPCLSRAVTADPQLHNPVVQLDAPRAPRAADGQPLPLYLQTSPEAHMKRLLAAGSGPIYQIGRAFRDGEAGALHNPEFTMLEWYRPGWNHRALMDEVDALAQETLGLGPARRVDYGRAFADAVGLDPHVASTAALADAARTHGVDAVGLDAVDDDDPALRATWRQLLWADRVEPRLGRDADGAAQAWLVEGFPADEEALARLRDRGDGVRIASRFELYADGVELANGYDELIDADEQRRRFAADAARTGRPVDDALLAALDAGLPVCAGVALGVDRLLMVRHGATSIDAVLTFPIDRA
ncbi:MAG: EF-P lysine aminoacylase EpmA [Acidobacteriota bacterium]